LANIRRNLEAGRPGIHRLELIASGDRVVLCVAGSRFPELGGATFGGQAYVVFTLRGGRIVHMHDFRSRDEALTAANMSSPAPR
jgi:hypothetical protein